MKTINFKEEYKGKSLHIRLPKLYKTIVINSNKMYSQEQLWKYYSIKELSHLFEVTEEELSIEIVEDEITDMKVVITDEPEHGVKGIILDYKGIEEPEVIEIKDEEVPVVTPKKRGRKPKTNK